MYTKRKKHLNPELLNCKFGFRENNIKLQLLSKHEMGPSENSSKMDANIRPRAKIPKHTHHDAELAV